MRGALRAAALLLSAATALVACGDAAEPDTAGDIPPISGSAIDAIRENLRAIRTGDGVIADRIRVERTEGGTRAVVHASLVEDLDEAAALQVCEAVARAASPVLEPGQSLEVHLLRGDTVVHSCGL